MLVGDRIERPQDLIRCSPQRGLCPLSAHRGHSPNDCHDCRGFENGTAGRLKGCMRHNLTLCEMRGYFAIQYSISACVSLKPALPSDTPIDRTNPFIAANFPVPPRICPTSTVVRLPAA